MQTFDLIISTALLTLSVVALSLCSYYAWMLYNYKRLVLKYINMVEEIFTKDKEIYIFCLKAIRTAAISSEDYETAKKATDIIKAQETIADTLKKDVH